VAKNGTVSDPTNYISLSQGFKEGKKMFLLPGLTVIRKRRLKSNLLKKWHNRQMAKMVRDLFVFKAQSRKNEFSTTTALYLMWSLSMIMTVCASPSVIPIPTLKY